MYHVVEKCKSLAEELHCSVMSVFDGKGRHVLNVYIAKSASIGTGYEGGVIGEGESEYASC